MQLEVKSFVDSTLALVDKATGNAIEATISNPVLTSSDPAIFTTDTDPNNDGIVDIVGIAEGTATLNVKADVAYTDPNTGEAITASKEANVEVTITAPPPGAIDTELIVTFSAPQPA